MIFAVHFANRQYYAHSHIIGGVAISHSHFHTDAHNETDCGGHTKESLLFIARTAQFETVDASSVVVASPLQFFSHRNKHVEAAHWIASIHLHNPTLRAPPVI